MRDHPNDLGAGSVGRHGLRLLDGLALLWVVLWVILGMSAGHEVRQLVSVSDSAEAPALAADRAGEALQSLRDLPLVGEDADEPGDEVRAAAREASANAAESRVTVERLGILLGIAIALLPLTRCCGPTFPPAWPIGQTCAPCGARWPPRR